MRSHKVHNLAAWDAAVLDARRLVARAQACRAYQDADGFDNYNTLSQRWETISGSPSISTAYRRFAPPSGCPGQGLYLPAGAYAQKNMQSNQATLILKCAYYGLGTPSSQNQIMGTYDNNTSQVAVVWLSSGAIQAWGGYAHTGGNIVLGGTGPGVIAPNRWFGVEIEITHAASGSVTVWVNGVEVLALTGVATNFSGNSYAGQVRLAESLNVGAYFDDYRVWDNTGSTQNAPIGTGLQDSRIITKMPSGAGALTQFTPNGASANWQCVDDNPPDGDTTYVSGSTASLEDAYAAPAAGFSAAPVMVVARAYARKDDAGTRVLAAGFDSSGNTSVGTHVTLGSSYAFVDGCIPDDPNTSALWTAAGADAAQILIEEIS